MSKEKKPILNLQKGCPFCGGTDLCYGYDPVLSRIDIVCKACNFTFSYKNEKSTNALLLAESIWNSRVNEKKPTVKSTVSTAEAILSELKDIKSYVAELAGYSIDEKRLEKEVKK